MDLTKYDVLVLPEGRGLQGVLGEGRMQALEGCLRAGGTLIAVGVGGSAEALGREMGDLELRRAEEEDLDEDQEIARALRTRDERDEDRWARSVPGTILKVTLDPGHPLAAGATADGVDREMFVLSMGRAFEPSEDFESVAFSPEGLERISGVISQKSLDRLDQSTGLAQVRVGRGRLIHFMEDPLFRRFWYSGFQPFANALLMGPVS